MSNRIDFFQSEQTSLVLPAATVSIFVDGVLCPNLELIEIVQSGWPDFNSARFAYNPAAHPTGGLISPEDIEYELAMGKPISIRQCYNSVPPGSAMFSIPIFHGHIERMSTTVSATCEKVEVIARDFSTVPKRVSVQGQRHVKTVASSVFLAGLDTIFNPDSQGNASSEPATINGKCYTIFCAEPSQSKLWSYAEVIDYLLCEYISPGQILRPNLDQLKTLTDNQIVRDLDVTELNLTEALHQCCERIGIPSSSSPVDIPPPRNFPPKLIKRINLPVPNVSTLIT